MNESGNVILDYPKYGLKFRWIFPGISKTVIEQEKILNPQGVVIVSFFNEQQEKLTNIIRRLEGLHYGFISAKRLHFTLLSLFDDKRKLDPYYRQLTLDAVEEFFDEHKSLLSGPLYIKCNLIRPGSWYKNSEEILLVSDGTVVLMADPEHLDTQKFLGVANSLEKYLKKRLPHVFGPSFKRKFPTMWCTLGYFTHDFEVTSYIKKTFPCMGTIETINIVIKDLEVVEFKTKDLKNAKRILGPFDL